jgi:hypothetical protein
MSGGPYIRDRKEVIVDRERRTDNVPMLGVAIVLIAIALIVIFAFMRPGTQPSGPAGGGGTTTSQPTHALPSQPAPTTAPNPS